ncbi:MAG: S-layer homology domain-containing protein [Oscillospiraceae bacterium]|nr:S-layer homology domain-containing protein [Oscillospiraceae bacterium]
MKIKEKNVSLKRILPLLLALVMIVGLIPATAFAGGELETPVPFGEVYWNPDPTFTTDNETHITIIAERYVNFMGTYMWVQLPTFPMIVGFRYGDTQGRTPQPVRVQPNEPGYVSGLELFRPNINVPTSMLEPGDRIVIRRHNFSIHALPLDPNLWTVGYSHFYTVPVLAHTISFDPGLGSGTMTSVTVPPGTYMLPANGFTAPTTPPGRTFAGWAVSGNSPEADTTLSAGAPITVNGAVTLTAQWTAGVGSHDVSFVANGGGGVMTAVPVFEGQTLPLPVNGFTAPTTPPGRSFIGWIVSGDTPQADATELRQAGFQITVNGPVTVTAQWSAGEWPISFDSGLGSGTMATVNVAPGPYTLPANGFTAPTTPPGRTFDGWLVSGDSPQANEKLSAGAQITVNGPVTLTAQWTAGVGAHNVSFAANGGGGTMTAESVYEGLTFTLPANAFTPPTAPLGRQFTGWIVSGDTPQADATELRQAGFPITVNGPVTVTAQWSAGEWPISFDPGAGSGTMATVNVAPGTYTLPNYGFTAPTTPMNRTFAGWAISGGSLEDGTTLQIGDTITVNGPVTLTAQWTVGEWPVAFAPGVGSGTMADVSVTAGAIFVLPANGFTAPATPANRIFAGWAVGGGSLEAGAILQIGDTITVNGPVTLTAQWTAGDGTPYDVNFDPGLGSGTMTPMTVTAGDIFPLPVNGFTAPTTPPGRQFIGWIVSGNTPEADATILRQAGFPITIEGSVTLTAHWSAGEWPVTFAPGLGSGTMATVNVADGATFALPANGFTAPTTPVNRTFAGWIVSGDTPEAHATTLRQAGFPITVNGPVTVTAQWTAGGTTGQGSGPSGGGGGTTTIVDTAPPLAPFITDHTAFISGFPDGSIQPNREITRAEVSMILWRLLDSNAKHAPQAARFQDVQATAWHAQAINYLASRDIVTGFPDGNFRPNAPITRAELTAIMSRFFELNDNGVSDFSDVANTHWAIAYINNANNRGWVTGFADGTFRPNNATTRAEAVTLMNRVLERTPNPATIDYHLNDIQLFSDLTPAHWAFYQIMEAAIEHDFYLDAQGLEVWENVVLPTR